MKGSKLISLVTKCSPQELKSLEKYISSPYYNTNITFIRLVKILRKAAPEYKEKKILKASVYASLFPESEYSEKKMSNLMSEMVKHIEQFWEIERRSSEDLNKSLHLAKSYFSHELIHLAEHSLESAIKNIYKSKPTATDFHEFLLDINILKHRAIESKEQRNIEPNLQAIHDHLDAYYLVSKLKYYYKCLNFSGLTEYSYDINMMDAVLSEAESTHYEDFDAIQIYYNAVKTQVSFENDENFKELKRLLIKNSDKYAAEEVKDMILTARNFAIRRLNRGESHYSAEALDLYKLEIDEGLHINADSISDAHTRNIILLAQMNKESEWALSFLTNNKRFISKETFTFCAASLKFDRGEYDEVLNLLSKTSFIEPLLNLSVKSLNLKTHYERFSQKRDSYEYEDIIEDYIKRFRKDLEAGREELTSRALFYEHLLDYVESLFIMLKEEKLSNAQLKKMKEKLNNEKQIAQKNWLLEKIDILLT